MILALETATRACSAALCDDEGACVAESLSVDGPAHAQRLLPGVHAVLTEAGVDWAEVTTIAVSLGPGAFTGLRIGIATARALAFADGEALLVGVPTLAALALALAGDCDGGPADQGRPLLVPLIDGRRSEVFAASYRAVGELSDLRIEPVDETAVVAVSQLTEWLSERGAAVVGGDGALLYADQLPPSARLLPAVGVPTAAMIGRAAAAGVPGLRRGFDAVLPLYGRRPDAVPRAAAAGAAAASSAVGR